MKILKIKKNKKIKEQNKYFLLFLFVKKTK